MSDSKLEGFIDFGLIIRTERLSPKNMSKHTRLLFCPFEVGIISKFSTNILCQGHDLLCIRIHICNSFRI